MTESRNPIESIVNVVWNFFDRPVTLFREKIVVPNQQHYPWYHQKFRRVPTIDECYSDDFACKVEANQQYQRDKMVDNEILSILRTRAQECRMFHGVDRDAECVHLDEAYERAAANWFSKHGDIGPVPDARQVYMKQKHRMVWERRHGPIGSGMKAE